MGSDPTRRRHIRYAKIVSIAGCVWAVLGAAFVVGACASFDGFTGSSGPGGDEGGADRTNGGDGGTGADVSAGDVTTTTDGPGPADAATGTDAIVEAGPPCAQFDGAVCAPPVPTGQGPHWTGPVLFYGGPYGTVLPGCPQGSPLLAGNGGLDAGDASCTPCACDAPTNLACAATLYGFSQSSCSQEIASGQNVGPTGCSDIPLFSNAESYVYETTASGSCAPSGGQATLPPLTWSTTGETCSAPSGGGSCSSGSCVSLPPGALLCIQAMSGGQAGCPSGYPKARTFYGNEVDMRGCSACVCDGVTGASCQAQVNLDTNDPNCLTFQGMLTMPSPACTTQTPGTNLSATLANVTFDAGSASCAPSGGKASGSVMPTQGFTVCCTQ